MKLLFLGTGSSLGTPISTCTCNVCTSSHPKNQRLRASVWIQKNQKNFLIDVSPDFRSTSLTYNIPSIDAIFVTHYHEDHIGGFNDLRPYLQKKIPLVLSESTWAILSARFHYLIDCFSPIILKQKEGYLSLYGEKIHFFTYMHKCIPVTGYRFSHLAYVTDIKTYEKTIFTHLQDVQVLVISALSHAGSSKHFSIEEATEFSNNIPLLQTGLFTHISHKVDHTKTVLPKPLFLAYDGLEVDV